LKEDDDNDDDDDDDDALDIYIFADNENVDERKIRKNAFVKKKKIPVKCASKFL